MSDPLSPKHDGSPENTGDPEALERQRMLGARLQSLFDDVTKEPVPDDFMDLLNRLDDSAEQN